MTSMQNAEAKAARMPRMPERNLDHIPGDYGLPVIGGTLGFLTNLQGLVEEAEQKYGRIFRGSAMMLRGVTLLGPEANEFVLRDRDHVLSSRLAWNPLLEKLFTNGLMLRDFANHKYHRRIMQQAFKKDALAGYMEGMNPHIRGELARWPVGREFLFFGAIKSLLLDTGAGIFLGLKMGPEAKKVNESFVAEVDASLAVVRLPIPGTTWHRGMAGRRFLEKFMMDLIPEKRRSRDSDFFSELCRAADEDTEAQFTDEDVMNHMIFLLFAAHDTTTSTLSSIMYALAKHPEWQETLAAEMAAVGADELAYEDLPKLEKTTWVFREALRMHPPLPTIPRRTIEEIEWQGYRIPANTMISIVPLHTHYMPEYWSDPWRFDPARFSPERAEDKKHFFQWVPFGGGHHKCLGLNFAEIQSKVFLFHFLREYRIRVRPGYEMQYQQVPLAVPKDGLPVTIEKR